VALVPLRFIVSGPLAPLLFTVSVAVSFVPEDCLGVNVRTIVQEPPLAMTWPLVQVPAPVSVKSAALVPPMESYGVPNVRSPDPVQLGMLGVEQLLTEMVSRPDVVEVPCLPKVSVGDGAQFALLPVSPLFGQRITVAPPPPPAEAMPMLRLAVLLCELGSVTCTVNELVPAAVGVPLI
jgi:hypothetical protein